MIRKLKWPPALDPIIVFRMLILKFDLGMLWGYFSASIRVHWRLKSCIQLLAAAWRSDALLKWCRFKSSYFQLCSKTNCHHSAHFMGTHSTGKLALFLLFLKGFIFHAPRFEPWTAGWKAQLQGSLHYIGFGWIAGSVSFAFFII